MSLVATESFSVHIVIGDDVDTNDFWWNIVHLILGTATYFADADAHIIARSEGRDIQSYLIRQDGYDAVGESYYVATRVARRHVIIRAYESWRNAGQAFAEYADNER